MKSFSVTLIFSFALLHSGIAQSSIDIRRCIEEHGFTKTDLSKEREACVLACVFQERFPNMKDLHEFIKDIMTTDDRLTSDQLNEMTNTLNTCKMEAGGDNCKFLHCIKITESPFSGAAFVISYLPPEVINCFVDNGLKPGDVHYLSNMKDLTSFESILQKLDENKFSCALTCMYNKRDTISTNKESLETNFAKNINDSKKITDAQKAEMLATLNKCATEAAGDDCQMVKCIKMFRPPFSELIKIH